MASVYNYLCKGKDIWDSSLYLKRMYKKDETIVDEECKNEKALL